MAHAAVASAQVTVEDAWVRGTVQDQRTTGAFMKLRSATDSALVGVRSALAARVEIHETSMHGGMMRMREVPRVTLPANASVDLKPGGHHLMLVSLKQPVSVGDKVPLTLTFEDRSGNRTTLDVSATVRPLAATANKHVH